MAPAIVLIPGMCCVGSLVFEPLVKQLEALGLTDSHMVDLPSIQPVERLVPDAYAADVAAVRRLLERILSRDKDQKDVVIVGHSYGGGVALIAADGFWKSVRSTKGDGNGGGVTKVGLIATSVNLPGDSVHGTIGAWLGEQGVEVPPPSMEETEHGLLFKPTIGLDKSFFSDMDAKDAAHWESILAPMAIEAMRNEAPPVDVTAWKASYLLTVGDPIMPVPLQELLIDRARKAGATVDIERMTSGHFAQITHAKEVAEWIKRLAE